MTLQDPMRRNARLIVETAGDDVVVYDRATDRVTSLEGEAAKVFTAIDGGHSVEDIATLAELSEAETAASLLQLQDAGLVEGGMSRRLLMQRAGLVGAGVGVASLASVLAPVAAHAASVVAPEDQALSGVYVKTPIVRLDPTFVLLNTKKGVYANGPVVGTGFDPNTQVVLVFKSYFPGKAEKLTYVNVVAGDDGSFKTDVNGMQLPTGPAGTVYTLVAQQGSTVTAPVNLALSAANGAIGTGNGVVGSILG